MMLKLAYKVESGMEEDEARKKSRFKGRYQCKEF